ncbi:putative membrane channel-forming protein YqfA (hemolysin III family) [Bradyrhizobium sp. AZCC 1708]
MTIFRLKQIASTSIHAAAGAMHWNYDRAELIADGVVHIVGVCFGLIAATALIVLTAVYAGAFEITVVSVYVTGLLAMLTLSAVYNLWPVSRAKWVLRRFDHSAIYLLIAATYTPFIVELRDSYLAIALLTGVWCIAIAACGAKTGAAGAIRSFGGRPLSRLGLERRHALRRRGEGGAAAGAGLFGGRRRAL